MSAFGIANEVTNWFRCISSTKFQVNFHEKFSTFAYVVDNKLSIHFGEDKAKLILLLPRIK